MQYDFYVYSYIIIKLHLCDFVFISHALQAKLEKQKMANSMKQFKVTLQDKVLRYGHG